MIDRYKTICVIPARGGSKGVPRKNIKHLAGKPLIAYTIEQALQSRYIDRTLVSTDDEEIANISKQYGAEAPYLRPEYLSGDDASTIDVLLHAMDWVEETEKYDFDILVLLHTTTPLRNVNDIDSCIELLRDAKADNVFSVTEAHRNPYFNMIELNDRGEVKLVKEGAYKTRQSAPKVYDLNASIYVWWKDVLRKEGKIFLKQSKIYVMPKERSIDIDAPLDFKIAELLLASG
ncbi:MAG: acylneuraminate cytidylyltransferase family protein [Pseudomonadota bacterium]